MFLPTSMNFERIARDTGEQCPARAAVAGKARLRNLGTGFFRVCGGTTKQSTHPE
jgi:hypothetical protein